MALTIPFFKPSKQSVQCTEEEDHVTQLHKSSRESISQATTRFENLVSELISEKHSTRKR